MNKKQLVLYFVILLFIFDKGGLLPILPDYAQKLGAPPALIGYYLAFVFLALALGTFIAPVIARRIVDLRRVLILIGLIKIPIIFLQGQVSTVWQLMAVNGLDWFLAGIIIMLINICVDLQAVRPILEIVGGLDGVPRQLARLARRHEAAVEPIGERTAEDEASRLGAENDVWPKRTRELLEPVDRLAEIGRVGDERHQILEDDPGLREIRDVADAVAQVERGPRRHSRILSLGEQPQLTPEEKPRELLRRRGECLQVFEPRLAPLRVPRPQGWCDKLLEQARLTSGRVAEAAEVASVDPVLGELAARGSDLCIALAKEALPTLDARGEKPVLLERPCQGGVDAGPCAQLAEVQLSDALLKLGASPAKRGRGSSTR